ncbi:MAG: replication restart helicase PriA [Acutalibacteraceae bacterium]|jgi:primosomal protein N' (replication factor Y)
MQGLVARIALQGATAAFDKLYTYIIPPDLSSKAQAGCRVLVPFGKGNLKREGMIFERGCEELKGLKSIIALIDKEPILSGKMLSLCEYLRESTFCTYYDAIHAVLPAGLTCRLVNYYSANEEFSEISLLQDSEREVYSFLLSAGEKPGDEIRKKLSVTAELLEKMTEKQALIKNSDTKRRMNDATEKWVRIHDGANLQEIRLTNKQKEVISLLEQVQSASVKEICYFTGVSPAVVSALVKKEILIAFEKQVYRTPVISNIAQNREIIDLTDEQQKAFDGLLQKFLEPKPAAALLYGITGSGKTQVFLKLVDKAVERRVGTIVMVPEIALTPQLISIFAARYGNKISVFHSAMSMGQRMDEWKRIKDGSALIAIGTRSAVFAPFDNLGLVIIDEEQEHTYKSENSPRFHARDVARFRISQGSGLLCLASATPSVESYTAAIKGKLSLFTLKNRYGNAVLPTVEIVDMREELRCGNTGAVSRRLYEALCETLENGRQAILLLNRRGHNTYISCPDCGSTAVCPHCSISLTYHSANKRLMCHYCGYSVVSSKKCPECGGEHMKFLGLGTQKAEEELKVLFPDAKILRLDADSTVSRDSYSSYLTDFANGKYNLLLGTQMVAKGLDFPNVTLVGVLGADNSMYSEDFRSTERTFALLTQVVGRAGRGENPGIAVIQTFNPDNNIIELAKNQDYESFYNEEILNRKIMIYPPYCDICVVSTRSKSKQMAQKGIEDIFGEIKRLVETKYNSIKIIILGPSPAAVAKVKNRYRYRMIIKCKNNALFRQMIKEATAIKLPQDTAVAVDINPETII